MSNKSGTSSQVISLPQGGGALHGIGETFSPDLFTGTGNFTVPIALPPGRNGFQPQLNLVYSTGNGNSHFGLGWSLSIPGVSRKTSQGIPRYDDTTDTFILSGAEDLVPVEQKPGVIRYQPRTEGLFARIEHHRDANNNYWQVWSKDGLVSFYGTPRLDDVDEEWHDPAVIADPSDRTKIFAWKLSRTIDPFGNRIEYDYERDLTDDRPHHWDQVYLKQIRYADYGDRADATLRDRHNPQFLVSVTFEYEERPDPFSEYRSGFEIRTRRRCREIQVRTHADQERRVRTYPMIYLDQRQDLDNREAQLPLNGVSLLSQVQVIGHDRDTSEALPPLEFDYTRFEPQGREFFPVQGRDLPARSLSSPDLELADLFGNGLPDILEMNGTVRYWRNLGNGRFDLPRPMKTAPAGLTLADPGVQLIDANGDGRIDLLVTNERLSGYFPLRFGGLWDRKSFQKYEVAPSFNLEAPEVQLIDLTGDGVTDVIRSGSRLECFFNHPARGWTKTRQVERRNGFGRVEQCDTETFEEYNQAGLHGSQISFERVAGDRAHYFSPPTLTKTWFHQGPVGDEFGEWEELDYSEEYWAGDPQVLARPAEITEFLQGLPRRVKRDALRTLRGQVLRTELYALDGTEWQDRPYTVTESVNGVREESPPDPEDSERRHIFFPHGLAQRTTQWERGEEPMTQFSFTADYDYYGQPQMQASLAVPRGRDFRVAAASNQPYLATQGVMTYAQRNDELRYIVDRVAGSTTYEIVNDGSSTLFDLWEAIRTGTAARELIGQSFNYYDGAAFTGLPLGELGEFGALVRTETLVLTEAILQEAYRRSDVVLNSAEMPPYLQPDGTVNWTDEYPQAFRSQMPSLAGYIFYPGDEHQVRGYFVTTARQQYDFQRSPEVQGRGLLRVTRDPLERDTTITYDPFDLLPIRVTDAIGLTTEAEYDYRVMQPDQVIDPNGNRQRFGFTPLGLLANTAVMGKVGEAVGDTPEVPGTRLLYDFLAFRERQQPISVCTIQREHHFYETDVLESQRDDTIKTIEYSDGLGRLLQTRTQAEDVVFGTLPFGGDVGLPGDQSVPVGDAIGQELAPEDLPRVVVSGWQVYDNKGRVVEKYEPFYATGWEYVPPVEEEMGQKATMFYDPRGQVIRTVNPDGSEQRVIYGIPETLDNPEQFVPTPWEAYTYDGNDNAGRTHAAESVSYQVHWNTPANVVVDALGRTVEAVERNGANSETDWYVTRSAYDIRGNLLTATDALGRVAFRYVYDLGNNPLRTDSIDAGVRRSLLDAVGNEIERRDSKGALILQGYDLLNRPSRLWARDDENSVVTLREVLEYGDGGNSNQPQGEREAARGLNRLGQLVRHYDEAGQLSFASFDFKGNLLEKTRRVIADQPIRAVFAAAAANNWQVNAFRVNWQAPEGMSLESYAETRLNPTNYVTSMTYDGLNRMKVMRYPEDVEGNRRELRPQYNRAGALDRVTLNAEVYVERIAYNAKGQRILIAYGNGIMTRYVYDPETFRLQRLRSDRYTQPEQLIYRATGQPLQDYGYDYDLVGNIVTLRDRTPNSGIPNTMLGTDALDRSFTYDPIYRLLTATGRECDRPPETPPWDDRPRCMDLTRTRAYREVYQYDSVGNMQQLRHEHFHTNGSIQGRNRQFALVSGEESVPLNNRLATVTIGQTEIDYSYDDNGNMTQEGESRHFEWDSRDRMKVFRTQTGVAEPSIHAHYVYDTGGQRVMKWVRRQGGEVDVTVYVDGVFEHHRRIRVGGVLENNTLHLMDDQSRIALVRVGEPFAEDSSPAVKFQLGDHLGSSNVVVSDAGDWVNREEFTPYGETSFGSFGKKRYRFTGKERDEESGLNYHVARYYFPQLAKWGSPDPIGATGGLNLYLYTTDNPLKFVDPLGANEKEPKLQSGVDLEQSQIHFGTVGFGRGELENTTLNPGFLPVKGKLEHNFTSSNSNTKKVFDSFGILGLSGSLKSDFSFYVNQEYKIGGILSGRFEEPSTGHLSRLDFNQFNNSLSGHLTMPLRVDITNLKVPGIGRITIVGSFSFTSKADIVFSTKIDNPIFFDDRIQKHIEKTLASSEGTASLSFSGEYKFDYLSLFRASGSVKIGFKSGKFRRFISAKGNFSSFLARGKFELENEQIITQGHVWGPVNLGLRGINFSNPDSNSLYQPGLGIGYSFFQSSGEGLNYFSMGISPRSSIVHYRKGLQQSSPNLGSYFGTYFSHSF